MTQEPRDAAERRREHDDTLALMFMWCHPELTPASAIALTLRAIGGLTTAEIASAFLVPEATMAQRISRAKRTIKESGTGFRMPTGERVDRASALGSSHPVSDLQRGLPDAGGPELARADLALRGDPARAHRPPSAAGRLRGRRAAGADAADRGPPRSSHDPGRRARPARRAGPFALEPRPDQRGRRAASPWPCAEGWRAST